MLRQIVKKKFIRNTAVIMSAVMALTMTACGGASGNSGNSGASGTSESQGAATSSGTQASGAAASGETVTIGIGYQTVTAQTWGGLIMKNQKLLEQELAADYPNQKFEIEWENATSGPPLTNNMVAGKLQFAIMGDLPILVNGEKGETEQNYSSVFLCFDGKGKDGANQALLVTKDGEINSVEDLKGKEVSTPIGSSAHRMLELVLEKYNILDDVTIVSQDVNVGLTNIEQGKIAAHATWEPFPTLSVNSGKGEILVDGRETGVDYLDGVVADRNWAEANEGYTIDFLKALYKAHQFIKEHPEETAKIFAEETGYSEDITKAMVENINFETQILPENIETVRGDLEFAISVGNVKSLDLDRFIDDSYLKKAYKELGVEQ